MWNYSEKVKDHFFSPRNAKAVEDANAVGDVGSMSCGDALRLTLKVNPDTSIIEEAGFQTFGCGSAIASSSALTELIIGKTLEQAATLSNQDIADYLDGLPPEKMHCSVMGMEALEAAIANYRGEAVPEAHEEGNLICKCFAVDDVTIKNVVAKNNLTTLEQVVHYTKAGGACSSCHEKIEWVLEQCLADQNDKETAVAVEPELIATSAPEIIATSKSAKPATKRGKTLVQRIRIIEEVLEEARPAIKADGGDIQLSDVDNDMVFVNLSGACSGCSLSGATLAMIEERLTDALGEDITVYPVGAGMVSGGLA